MSDDLYPPEMGPTPQELQQDEPNFRRAVLAKRVTLLVIALVLGLSLAINTYAVVAIRATQNKNSPVIKNTADTLAAVKDCTQPEGKCYSRGQRRTAKVLSDVSGVIVLAAACAVDVRPDQSVEQRQDAITACITTRLSSQP
jgi:hypothetical protein